MFNSLWVAARRVLAAHSDNTPWMATIDEFSDKIGNSGYDGAEQMVTLLTAELERRKIVRMSSPDAARLAELDRVMKAAQDKFTTPERFPIAGGNYSRPFGPYYMALSVPLASFSFHLIDEQPVKYLRITNCRDMADVAMLLRNDRLNNQYMVELQWTASPRDVVGLAQAVKEAKLDWCQDLILNGVHDINRVVAMNFIMAKCIYQGTVLRMGRPPREVMRK